MSVLRGQVQRDVSVQRDAVDRGSGAKQRQDRLSFSLPGGVMQRTHSCKHKHLVYSISSQSEFINTIDQCRSICNLKVMLMMFNDDKVENNLDMFVGCLCYRCCP